jgi:putative endonuclease
VVVVYAIWSESGRRVYVGMSKDFEKRLKQHNSGQTRSTKKFCPWTVIYEEECASWVEGIVREKYFKSGIGKEFLKKLVP